MTASLRRLIDWMAAYTLAPPGDVLAMALRTSALSAPRPQHPGWRRVAKLPEGARLTEARSRVLEALADGVPRAERRARPADRRRCGRDPWDGECGAAGTRHAASPLALHPSGPRLPRRRALAGPARRRARAPRGGGGAVLLRHPARRRDRVRQDRDLSGSRRRVPAPQPPGARAAAGDRALLAVARALRAALRRGAGGLAFRPHLAHAPRHLARGGGGRGAGRGRRPLGAVPAVPRSRPGGGGRGARDRVQAGGRRRLSRARHGRGARPLRRSARGAGLGDAQPRDARQCRGRPLHAPHAVRPPRRRASAGDRDDRSAPDAARARPLPVPAADRGDRGDAGARRAGDAVPQSPRLRAAHAMPRLRASDAVPELHRLAGRAPRAPAAPVPPLRPCRADPADLPELRRRRTA